jgi:ADP-dependent NAD(P)H-hydrate dehydratase / NAD(P)H-hydrate epimerase
VVVVAGKGNNGADGRVAAAFLSRRGVRVTMIDAGAAPPALPPCDLVIDGAYGTGFRGAYDAPDVGRGIPVLSIDFPSGVDANTGDAPGTPFIATHTVTFAAYKPGLLQGAGPRLSGVVQVVDIGIALPAAGAAMIEDADVARWLPVRPRQSHKWSTALGVASGSAGMEGSAVLCTRGALAAGAGMVRLGTPGNPPGNWPTEAVRVSLEGPRWAGPFVAATEKCRAVVIGPGLGTGDATQEEMRDVIVRVPQPLVIDADALTALGDAQAARQVLARRTERTILTPHDGEYARLAGHPVGEDRLAAAFELADKLRVVVLLKGPATVVAHPDGKFAINPTGTPALATAGTGDVLTGIVAALLARGAPPFEAAAAAAWIHGQAAVVAGTAPGLVAGDLIDALPRTLRMLSDPSED